LSRCQSLAVLLGRFHSALRRVANAVVTRGVRTTQRVCTRHATPTLGLGWSICSTNTLRCRLNAAALLVSGGHPYSLAIPTYYEPSRLSPKRRSGVSRLVSGGLDMTWVVNPRQWSVADLDPWSCLPACEHSFERDLIPAYYTCRSCSPVGSEARTANSDFTNPPFPEPRLSAGTMFRIELATASTSSGLPTSATPHLALLERRWRAATRGA